MRDPVLAVGDGRTYERDSIVRWFAQSGGSARSPVTNLTVASMEVVANVALRDMLTRLAGEKGKLGSPGSEPVGGGGGGGGGGRGGGGGAATCVACGAAEGGTKLLTCSRCRSARYCGRDCQRAHWKSLHKHECVPCTT